MFLLKDLPTREMIEQYQQQFAALQPDTVLDALGMLRRASLLLRSIEQYFTEHDLSQTRYLILVLLDRELEQNGLLASDLVSKLDLSKPVISKTVSTLIRQGYITERRCSNDRRAKWLQLTDLGREKLYEILPGYFAIIQEYMVAATTKTPS